MRHTLSGCCAFCCPCLWRRGPRALEAAAVPEETDESTSKLLPSSSSKARKSLGKTKSSKHKRPPSHLRELSGDINQVVRLVLVGSCDTGKTCLLRRFLGGYFDEAGKQDYTRTLGVDFGCKTVELADRRVRLQMWDTGGSETYRSVVSHYLRGADGVIMCYDVNRKTTLRALRSTWAPFLDKHTPRTCRVLLAGNKADSRGESCAEGAEIFPEDAKRFADAIEAQVFDTSAKLGTNVDKAVLALMREVLHHRQFAAQTKTTSDEKGVSPTRKGRKRLSVALRNVMESGSEGDPASCDGGRGGETPRSSLKHDFDDTVTEGTSSAASSSVSQRDGDSSDQSSSSSSSSNGKGRGIKGRTWAPFPNTDDRAGDSSVQGDGVHCRRSTTGGISGRSPMTSGYGKTGPSGGGEDPNDSSCVTTRGRYHFFNKLVIATPSRARSIDSNANNHGDGGDCGRGGSGGDFAGGGESSVRSRAHNANGGSPGDVCRRSYSGKDDAQKTAHLPNSSAPANVLSVSVRPQRHVAKPPIDASPPSMENPPMASDVDERQRREGGSSTKTGVDDFMTAAGEESTEAPTSTGACDASRSHSPDTMRLSVTSQETATENKSPQQVQRQPQRSVECNVADDGDVNGGFCPTLATSSASSSFSTVVIGDDPVRHRGTFPVPERE